MNCPDPEKAADAANAPDAASAADPTRSAGHGAAGAPNPGPEMRGSSATAVACQAIRPGAILPERMTDGASGFDLHACLDEPLTCEPGRWVLIPTGLVLAIPKGYEGTVRARSGLAVRHGIGVLNGPGTIDSDYRGEVKVILMNWGPDMVEFKHGDRIAQLVFQQVPAIALDWGTVDPETARGAGGFGHTGTAPRGEQAS
jgi:dUTP pyrophosphatase